MTRVKYIKDTNCQMCIDTFPEQIGSVCTKCIKARTKYGELVSTHAGFFNSYAIVRVDNKLEKVLLNEIEIL